MRAIAAPRMSKDQAGYEAWLEKIDGKVGEILKEADLVDAAEDGFHGEERGDELPKELYILPLPDRKTVIT